MDPKDMNTINKNGKAYNGNRGAVLIAYGFLFFVVCGLVTHVITSLTQ